MTKKRVASRPLADLLDARLELIALKEDDEHRLVHVVALTTQYTYMS